MRFDKIEKFEVEHLYLDEENYRFARADDQRACIEAIYRKGPETFLNLMESIAKDDVGELILVYREKTGSDCIVMDGNRRISALQTLLDPSLAPDERCARHARRLREIHEGRIPNEVQAQVSSDKATIMKTVYERHAASGAGLSRLAWSALASARFRHAEAIEDRDWKSMALLSQFESVNPSWKEFIDSEDYSHDVFRRVMRAAISEQAIDPRLFIETNRKLEKSLHKRARQKAMALVKFALESIKDNTLTLSRRGRGAYADESGIKALLTQHGFIAKNTTPLQPDNDAQRTQSAPATERVPEPEPAERASQEAAPKRPRIGSLVRFDFSGELDAALDRENAQKLRALYTSLSSINLRQHSILAWVGAWSFYECLGAFLNPSTSDHYGHLKGQALSFAQTVNPSNPRSCKGDVIEALDQINRTGNCNKHSQDSFGVDASQVAVHFRVLTPFVIWLLNNRNSG